MASTSPSSDDPEQKATAVTAVDDDDVDELSVASSAFSDPFPVEDKPWMGKSWEISNHPPKT